MTTEERLAMLEIRVWNQSMVIYQITSLLQKLYADKGRSLHDEAHEAMTQLLAHVSLATDTPVPYLDESQDWLKCIDPNDPQDVLDVLKASAPASGSPPD